MDSQRIYDRRTSRLVDELAIAEYGMLGLVLMENAARGCAEELLARPPFGRVVIVVGKGNNGGDGLAMARHLDRAGVSVKVLLTSDAAALQGDALANYRIAVLAGLELIDCSQLTTREAFSELMRDADWIVDAMLGTGATGEPRGAMRWAVEAMNQSAAKRLAIDLPTGMDCDTGAMAIATVRADVTCTFVARKPCCVQPACWPYLGEVMVIDIGVPRRLIERIDADSSRSH